MRLYALGPAAGAADGPFVEVLAPTRHHARRKAAALFPHDGWADEARFDCEPLCAPREERFVVATRYPNRAALPPVR